MSRRLKQAAVLVVIVFAAAQLVRPERANPPTVSAVRFRRARGPGADWSPSWIARAATVTRTRPCGRGTHKSRPCPGSWRTA